MIHPYVAHTLVRDVSLAESFGLAPDSTAAKADRVRVNTSTAECEVHLRDSTFAQQCHWPLQTLQPKTA